MKGELSLAAKNWLAPDLSKVWSVEMDELYHFVTTQPYLI